MSESTTVYAADGARKCYFCPSLAQMQFKRTRFARYIAHTAKSGFNYQKRTEAFAQFCGKTLRFKCKVKAARETSDPSGSVVSIDSRKKPFEIIFSKCSPHLHVNQRWLACAGVCERPPVFAPSRLRHQRRSLFCELSLFCLLSPSLRTQSRTRREPTARQGSLRAAGRAAAEFKTFDSKQPCLLAANSSIKTPIKLIFISPTQTLYSVDVDSISPD